jgi:hypothetical protein
MKRYGRHVLRYFKKAYVTAQGFHKEALNRYILAHLFVAQVAGKIQGLIDGDLGDLGSASLTERELMHLLDLGINEVVKIFDEDASALTVSCKRWQKISNQTLWCPFDGRQQLQLELVSRLLACAQRLYISREGWNALESPKRKLEAVLKKPISKKDDEWIDHDLPETHPISVRVLAKSPWMYLILKNLMSPNNVAHPVAIDKINDKSWMMPMENPLIPVLKLVNSNHNADKSPIPYLAIIGAAAEMFPSGECWASSPIENWHCFLPEDKKRGEVIWCHGSSVFDLVSILSILSKLLEHHGQSESDPRTQYWILLILTKLTEPTAAIVQNMKNNRLILQSLTTEWRMIWKNLLRQDLRYTSYVNYLGEDSLGEILIILLTEIISRKCTEVENTYNASEYRKSSFIYEQQNHLWSLLLRKPAIFKKIRSRSLFELISSISKFAGLSEAKIVEESQSPLRYELVRLSLCSFKEVLMKRSQSSLQCFRERELIQSIASCIVCLINGSCPFMPRSLSSEPRFSTTRFDNRSLSVEENGIQTNVTQEENN